MKRFLSLGLFVLILVLHFPAALADPLPLTADYADTVTIFYNGEDSSDGQFIYSYRFPHADPEDPTAYLVNTWYDYKIPDTINNDIPNMADNYASMYQDVKIDVSYEVTCNGDDFFSVLIHTVTEISEDGELDEMYETWEGNTFSRLNGKPDQTFSLLNLLGLVDSADTDDWLEEYQTEKASAAVFALVWEEIRENPGGLPFDPDFPQEDLETVFNPDRDFYLDRTGNPVFYILPRDILTEDSREGAGLVTFRISLEEILDEMDL